MSGRGREGRTRGGRGGYEGRGRGGGTRGDDHAFRGGRGSGRGVGAAVEIHSSAMFPVILDRG